jgi:hypothetical protein
MACVCPAHDAVSLSQRFGYANLLPAGRLNSTCPARVMTWKIG